MKLDAGEVAVYQGEHVIVGGLGCPRPEGTRCVWKLGGDRTCPDFAGLENQKVTCLYGQKGEVL